MCLSMKSHVSRSHIVLDTSDFNGILLKPKCYKLEGKTMKKIISSLICLSTLLFAIQAANSARNNISTRTILLFEDFESGMPSDWTVIDENSDGITWITGTTPDLFDYTPPDFGTAYAYYSDDDAGSIAPMGTEYLISPVVSCIGIDSLALSFSWGFRRYDIPYGASWARFHNGSSWSSWYQLAIYYVDSAAIDTFDLSPYLPTDSVQIQFTYVDSTGGWAWAFGIDNVKLYVPENHDVGTFAVISPPGDTLSPGDYDIIGWIHNFGDFSETFDATANVYDTTGGVWNLIFTQTLTLTDFPVNADSLVTFGTVSCDPENSYTEIFTHLIGDVDMSNDTASSHPIVVYDVLFEMDVETPTGDNQCLGVEFDGTYFYVTGGNAGMDPNKIYVIDTLGIVIWTIDQPVHVTGWGWRHLCWDGTYTGHDRVDTLYAFHASSLEKFGIDLTSGILNYYGTIPVPGISGRALAYMPESLWFFTTDWDSIYKFGAANPALHQSTHTPWDIYGAAYDTDTAEGGWVWLHSQDDPWTGFDLQIEQFDPIEMSFTGLYFGYIPLLTAMGSAGDLCFYEGFRESDVLFALVQGNPDCIVGIFMRPHISPRVEEQPAIETPFVFGFAADMPNPIKNHATISYTTSTSGKVSLTIYDCAGRLIKTLVNTYQSAGTKTIHWDGKDNNHRAVPNGVYFLRLEAENKADTYKFILMQ